MRTLTANAAVKRDARWALHTYRRHHSVIAGGRKCMDAMTLGTVSAGVTAAGVVHLSGVARCGSVHACPVCAPVIRERRAVEIDSVLTQALAAGCSVFFVTATFSHQRGEQLGNLLQLAQSAWRKVWGGRAPKEGGYVGQCRVVEITDGINGWHPHIHAAVVLEPGHDADLIARAGVKWRRVLRNEGRRVSNTDTAWDVRQCFSTAGLSNYLTKVDGGWGVGLELARGDLKVGRTGGGFTPFELLQNAADGDQGAAERFAEYERATKGKRFIIIGRNLLARFPVEVLDDAEAAVAAVDGELVAVYRFHPGHWRSWVRTLGQVPDALRWCAYLSGGGHEPPPDWFTAALLWE